MNKESQFVSIKQLAELCCVSKQTITRQIVKGELDAVKIGKIYRITKKSALEWLERQKYNGDNANEESK